MTTEQRQELDARRGNRKIAVHSLAMEILRNGSSLMSMVEAIEQAKAILDKKGVRR